MHPQVVNAMQVKDLVWEVKGGTQTAISYDGDGEEILHVVVYEDGSLWSKDGKVMLPGGMFDVEGTKKFAFTYYASLFRNGFAEVEKDRVELVDMHFEPRRASENAARDCWDRVVKKARGYSAHAAEIPCSGERVWNMLHTTRMDYGPGSGVPVLDNVVLGRQRGMAGSNDTGIFLMLQNHPVNGWELTGVTDRPIIAGRWAAETAGDKPVEVGELYTIKMLEDRLEGILEGMYGMYIPEVKEEPAEQVAAETPED